MREVSAKFQYWPYLSDTAPPGQGSDPDTGHPLVGSDLPEGGDFPPAVVDRDGAPRVEDAPRGGVEWARHLPAQDDVLPARLHGRIRDGHRREEGPGVGVLRAL